MLIADRFLAKDSGRAIDLATGDNVLLAIGDAGNEQEQIRWAVRCDTMRKLHHLALAPLVDYGGLGRSQWFEAWWCGAKWNGAAAEAERAQAVASRCLNLCGLTAGNCSHVHSHGCGGRAVVLPDATAGYEAEAPRSPDDVEISMCGMVAIPRRTERVGGELFTAIDGCRPRILAVWGPSGSGKTTAVRELARAARLNGFVPVATRLLDRIPHEVIRNRTLCLIDDGADVSRWRTLLAAGVRSPRAHVLIVTGESEVRAVDGIRLNPLSPSDLVAAVRPEALGDSLRARVGRAADRAQGIPGRFVQLLWGAQKGNRESFSGGPASSEKRLPTLFSRVAEQSAEYGIDGDRAEERDVAPRCAWADPGELAGLRRRMTAARQSIRDGRHAPGIRQLRQAIAGLARRDDWAHAADGGVALAAELVRRGQPRAAHAVLDETRDYGSRGSNDAALVDIAVLSAHAWIDRGRLDEAESVAGAALAAARGVDDRARVANASAALGRCLFWRGRYGDAGAALPDREWLTPSSSVRVAGVAARVAVGLRDQPRAMALARESVEQAIKADDPAVACVALGTAAFVHLALDDLDSVEGDVRRCILAARKAHDPLCALRARVMLAEADRRRNRRPAAEALMRRLLRVEGSRLPPIVRARCDLLKDLLLSRTASSDVVANHIARTGLHALALYLPDAHRGGRSSAVLESVMDEVVGILHICQTAEEEANVLGDVCARIRRQLHAAAVAFVAGDGPSAIAADGGRIETTIAERIVSAGLTIAPHRSEDRIEGGAPVRYGGATIGAIIARWVLGTPHDLSHAPALLTMAAAAAGPAFSAVLARQTRASVPALDALLGVSPAMVDLRRAVERAAAAPFAVLIEGESGCGKELVARAIHRAGPRRDRSFVALNCAALPDELIEAELFGHARGAFTGAVGERIGVFEEAHGGTLLLDEVGELSPRAQAKVLRVIQEGELRRVGENVSRHVDVRILTATNRALRQEAAAGRFRLDLLYRLDVIGIAVPPLRERRDDIAVLADHFWSEATKRIGSRATLGTATLAALARYDWPGNVRELQNVLAALAVRCPRRGGVPPTALPQPFAGKGHVDAQRLDEARRTFEERFVRAALVRTGGHRARAAAELGLTRQGLTKLMTRLGISELV